jgi:hypothetical protein
VPASAAATTVIPMLVCTPPGPAGIGRCERCGDAFGKAFADDKLCRICAGRASLFIGASSAANGMTACPWLLPSCAVNARGSRQGRCSGFEASATVSLILRKEYAIIPQFTLRIANYCGFEGSQRPAANHRKFLSWQDTGVFHPGGNRKIDGDRPQGEPLWPPRCDDDPHRVPSRPARLRAVRSAMASGRAYGRAPARSTDKAGNAQHPSNAGRRDTCSAASTAGASTGAARLCHRAGWPYGAEELPHSDRASGRAGQDAISHPPAHAATCLRVRTGERRP